jgi:tetratricopeptide (TPR) repeat protein
MQRLSIIALLLVLGACASAPVSRVAPDLFRDQWFAPADEPIDGDAVFALSAPMRSYLAFDIAPQLHAEGPQLGLINALQTGGKLNIEYDSAFTRNAAEAFDARTGNCLSLVILTAALAGQVGLDVQFQEVLGDHVMSRNGDLVFYNGHVNVVLREKLAEKGVKSSANPATVIDFLASRDRRGQQVRSVSRQTVTAMYMNNRAAESMASGKVDNAYWWARAAIKREPRYTATYNTLGLVYRRSGHLQQAAVALEHALALEPANTVAMSNAIPVLRALGREGEAERWSVRLRELQPYPPFHFFDQGRVAMERGDFARASQLFAREIERAAYYHEFHYWLALAYVGLHEPERARDHFKIARDNATTRADAVRYQEAMNSQDRIVRKRREFVGAAR